MVNGPKNKKVNIKEHKNVIRRHLDYQLLREFVKDGVIDTLTVHKYFNSIKPVDCQTKYHPDDFTCRQKANDHLVEAFAAYKLIATPIKEKDRKISGKNFYRFAIKKSVT